LTADEVVQNIDKLATSLEGSLVSESTMLNFMQQVGKLLRQYKCRECGELWDRFITQYLEMVAQTNRVIMAWDNPLMYRGKPLLYCTFCGGKLPEHRETT